MTELDKVFYIVNKRRRNKNIKYLVLILCAIALGSIIWMN